MAVFTFEASGASSIRLISSNPPSFLKKTFQKEHMATRIVTRNNKRVFATLASPNKQASAGKRSSGEDVIMVDPVEAKRLAQKQMIQIQAKEKFKRRRQGEAINGVLAMIGLTASLVIEGRTGKGTLGQLTGYWDAFISLFMQ